MTSLISLTDDVLLTRLEALVLQERENVAGVVEHLSEVDRREIIIDRGYTTLFDYCLNKLRYSEAGAFLRIRAARAINKFPRILADLKSGVIHLDAVMRLYPYLSEANSDTLLDQAAGASKREIMVLVSRMGGTDSASERDVIRHLRPHLPPLAVPPQPPVSGFELSSAAVGSACPTAAGIPGGIDNPESAVSGSEHASRLPAGTVVVLPPRVRLAFTADDEFLVMVDRLRRLRRHKFPAGRLEDLLKEAVSALLDRINPDRRADRRNSVKPGVGSKGVKRSRWISAAIKAEVWERDGGRCAYVSQDGRRCEGRDFLEYDHVIPWALGGRSDCDDNIRLLCRPHNQRLARRRFGPRRRGS